MPRILLIEDDAATASAVRHVLASGGHEVLTTDNGETALSLIESEDIDVVIIDIAVRDVSRLVRAFHERAPEVPVIAITGHGFRG
jgi:DNA-binding NtrC family response regulator